MPRRDSKDGMGARLGTKMQSLGQGAAATGITGVLVLILISALMLFVNFHAVYLKTGTPMLKYGLAMTFLQPFYSAWATWVVASKYALGR